MGRQEAERTSEGRLWASDGKARQPTQLTQNMTERNPGRLDRESALEDRTLHPKRLELSVGIAVSRTTEPPSHISKMVLSTVHLGVKGGVKTYQRGGAKLYH